MRKLFLPGLCLLALLAAAPVLAQAQSQSRPRPGQAYVVHSGTGFFVSNNGYIITNHHVIEGCKQVRIQGGVPDDVAEVKAVDTEFDLALLKTRAKPRRFAVIRHPDVSRLEVGEPVLVMGYPLDAYKTGQYKIAEATIVGLKGPQDEPYWIQFSEAAQQGNSGGPLFDSAGHVAGVIVGTSQLYRVEKDGRQELVSKSDLAISLKVLMKFLDYNYVSYESRSSGGYMMAQRIEDEAKAYIVNVLCDRFDLPVK